MGSSPILYTSRRRDAATIKTETVRRKKCHPCVSLLRKCKQVLVKCITRGVNVVQTSIYGIESYQNAHLYPSLVR